MRSLSFHEFQAPQLRDLSEQLLQVRIADFVR